MVCKPSALPTFAVWCMQQSRAAKKHYIRQRHPCRGVSCKAGHSAMLIPSLVLLCMLSLTVLSGVCSLKQQTTLLLAGTSGPGKSTLAGLQLASLDCTIMLSQQPIMSFKILPHCAVWCTQHPRAAYKRGSTAGWYQWNRQKHPCRAAGGTPGHHHGSEHRQHPPHAA